MSKITMQDIAKELGITKTTVHRALTGSPYIKEETREKILNLATKYGYKPNKVARSLSMMNKKINIGVIIQSMPEFFWSNIIKGIDTAEKELNDFGVRVIYRQIKNRRSVDEILISIDSLIEEGVDAIALVPLNYNQIRKAVNDTVDKKIPVVTFNDDITDTKRLFYVGPRIRQSGRIAGELMARFLCGHGNVVAICGSLNSFELGERLAGFREVFEESYKDINIVANLSCNCQNVVSNVNEMLKNMLSSVKSMDGIYDAGGGTLGEIGEIKKNNPLLKDVICIGHELSDKVRDLLSERVVHACISQDPFSQGYHVIKLLSDYIIGRIKPTYERMYSRLDIIMKENIVTQNDIYNLF